MSRASIRASTCPADTASPSFTSTAVIVPMSFVLTVACCSGVAMPDASYEAVRSVSWTVYKVPVAGGVTGAACRASGLCPQATPRTTANPAATVRAAGSKERE